MRLHGIEDIQKNATMQLKAFPQQEWQYYWAKCIAAQGENFEGDSSQ
jgi:hypothetical protein